MDSTSSPWSTCGRWWTVLHDVMVDPMAGAPRVPPPSPAVASGTVDRRHPDVLILAGISLVLYVLAGLWIRYSLHYMIGDALNRTAHADYILFSRDPHLGAVGFVWLPLPTLLQVPLVALLKPFGRVELAGPLLTALCTSATVVVLGRIGALLGVRRATTLGITAAFALNPVIVFYAANGMSEAVFFLFAAIALLGYLGWVDQGRVNHLVVLALGLAGTMLVRYESVALVIVLAVLAAWCGRRLRPAAHTLIVVALPAALAFVLWLVASWLIVHDPLFWVKGLQNSGTPPADARWLPADRTLASGIVYAARLSLIVAPAALLLAPLVLLARRGRRIGGLGIIVAAGIFPLSVAWLLARNETWGNPRYFAPLILFSAIGAAWVASEPGSANLRRLSHLALVAVLVGGAVSATLELRDPVTTGPEVEGRVYAAMTGDEHATARSAAEHPEFDFQAWRRLARDLDRRMSSGELVIADSQVSFPAVLFSDHPERFVISDDRDYETRVADPRGIRYLIASAVWSEGSLPSMERLVQQDRGRTWRLVRNYGVARLYEARHVSSNAKEAAAR